MAGKPKVALYWCAGCGGCEESVIDLADELVRAADAADIVFWPVALDVRYRELEAMADGSIDAVFINGAVRLDDHVRMVRLLRQKSKRVIAHGACAHMGGVVGLGNLHTSGELLDCAFRQAPSMADPAAALPGDTATAAQAPLPLTGLLPAVMAVGQVVAVDAVIPGCPPPPETMARVIRDVIHGRLPAAGAVFARRKALCHQCPRRDSRPEKVELTHFKRLYETRWDPDICFLPQGLICLGPVTRGGCDARCIGANMPCRGCFGPTERMDDFGAGAVACIAAMMAGTDAPAVSQVIDSIPDPVGLFYRYALAASVLGKGGVP